MKCFINTVSRNRFLYDPLFSVSGRATSAIFKDPANKEHLPFGWAEIGRRNGIENQS